MTDTDVDDVTKDSFAIAVAFARADWDGLDALLNHSDHAAVIECLAFAYCNEVRTHIACHHDGQAPDTAAIVAAISADRDEALNR